VTAPDRAYFEEVVLAWLESLGEQLANFDAKVDALTELCTSRVQQNHSSNSEYTKSDSRLSELKPCMTGAGFEPRKTQITEVADQAALEELVASVHHSSELNGLRSSRFPGNHAKRSVWRFLEDSTSSTPAWVYSKFVLVFTGLSVISAFEEFVPQSPTFSSSMADGIIEILFDVAFLLELLLRFISCPSRRLFLRDAFTFFDLGSSVVPLVLRGLLAILELDKHHPIGTVLSLVPVLRIMKLVRRFDTIHLLVSAFQASAEALPVLLFVLLVIALTFSGLIYWVEPRSNMESLHKSFWFTIVTMSTVGYGDVTAKSYVGEIVCSALMVVSGLYLALPIGIVGHCFSSVWNDRERLLVIQQLRNMVIRVGLSPEDFHSMFSVLDSDHDGQLDLDEFRNLVATMQIKASKRCVFEVFKSFDDDGQGTVDYQELFDGIFPDAGAQLAMMQEQRRSNAATQEQLPEVQKTANVLGHVFCSEASSLSMNSSAV